MTETMPDLQMSYEGLVDAAREARKQIDGNQWTEGDLALRVTALGPDDRPRDPETGEFIADEQRLLRRYAEDIDMTYGAVQRYRQVAAAWPQDARSVGANGVGFEVHRLLVGQPDRFELIQKKMTTREAAALVRQRNSATIHEPGWFELLGEVKDILDRADRQLERAEAAIDRKPHKDLRKKAGRYAETAEDIAERLRAIENYE